MIRVALAAILVAGCTEAPASPSLPRYFLVGPGGAIARDSPAARGGANLLPGFGVAILEERLTNAARVEMYRPFYDHVVRNDDGTLTEAQEFLRALATCLGARNFGVPHVRCCRCRRRVAARCGPADVRGVFSPLVIQWQTSGGDHGEGSWLAGAYRSIRRLRGYIGRYRCNGMIGRRVAAAQTRYQRGEECRYYRTNTAHQGLWQWR